MLAEMARGPPDFHQETALAKSDIPRPHRKQKHIAGWILDGAKAQQSLIPATEHQLGERIARTIKSDSETAVDVLDADQVSLVAPGGQGWGWLVLNDVPPPPAGTVCVLKMQFAADAKGTVDALLVLTPATVSEVARARRAVD